MTASSCCDLVHGRPAARDVAARRTDGAPRTGRRARWWRPRSPCSGEAGQAFGVALLTPTVGAIVVFLCPLGMQFGPARDAVGHAAPAETLDMKLRYQRHRRGALFPRGRGGHSP